MLETTLLLPDPGLHARAALAVVRAARRHAAQVRVGYAASWADAARLAELLALGAPGGASVTLRADGPDASEALAAVAEALEGGGQGSGVGNQWAEEALDDAEGARPGRRVYRGVGAAPGRASGRVVIKGADLPLPLGAGPLPLRGRAGGEGCAAALRQIEALQAGPQAAADPALADLLAVYAELLRDPAWLASLATRPAPSPVERELLGWLGEGEGTNDAAPYILLAEEIVAADLFGRPGLRGAATVRGGAGSHATLVARALGLPLAAGLPRAVLDEVAPGAPAVVDGRAGTLTVG